MRIMFFVRSLLFVMGMLAVSAVSFAQVRVGVAITIAPPELPVYDQPICPGDGYIWTPGYWAYEDDDYYWVPGTWVLAPAVGFLWTPGYWGWVDGGYVFYDGYWGPQVGFYGGINYGFGYSGHGFEGGRWDHDHFFYNRSVTNVNVTVVHNVYNTTVVNRSVTRVSFNGGNGGINERPTSQEEAAAHERHIAPVASQTEHVQAARVNTQLRASSNHGKPPVAATSKPGDFRGSGVVAAREAGAVHSSDARSNNDTARPNTAVPNTAVHPRDIPAAARPAAPNTGNAKQDQKYQQQQEKLQQKQDQERQKLQQKQDQDHQRLEQQKANDARKQQMEQQHQRQTQQLEQKHTQQQQKMQQRQQPPARPSQARPPKP